MISKGTSGKISNIPQHNSRNLYSHNAQYEFANRFNQNTKWFSIYCCLRRISSIDKIDWKASKINWVQEHFHSGAKEIFVVPKLELEREKNLKMIPIVIHVSHLCFISKTFSFFSIFPLELKKTNRKKNFNFLLSTWCRYRMRILQCIWRCLYSFNTWTVVKSTSKRDSISKMAGKSKKNWNSTSVIKTLSKFNFLSHHFCAQRYLTFMTWRNSLWKCSSLQWFVRKCCWKVFNKSLSSVRSEI